MPRKHLARAFTLLIPLVLGGGTTLAAEAELSADENLARARSAIERLGTTVTKAKTLRVNFEVAYDVVQESGLRLEFGAVRSLVLRRPDRLHVAAERRDGKRTEFYFDGKTGTLSHPDEKVYSRTEMGPTVDAALDMLEDELGVPMPSGDFLHSDLPKFLAEYIEDGFWVGAERLDGVLCDHVSFPTEIVDAQVWVTREKPAVIRRVVLTYVDEPGQPQFRTNYLDWQFGVDAPDDLFVFKPVEGTEQVPFVAIGGAARGAPGRP